MNRTEVEESLTAVASARKAWSDSHIDLNININRVMRRLIHEAVVNRMSVEQVAGLSGTSTKRVRELMRTYDLDPKGGKQMLSRKAAEALANNAELLGIEPREMDLMSPLAYLPAGSELRKQMASQSVSQVTDVPGFPETSALTDVHMINYHDHEVACGHPAYNDPVLITSDLDKITCNLCRDRMVRE